MMDQAILDFAKQFDYQPQINNEGQLKRREKVIVCGLGGSHLAADIIKDLKPKLRLTVHRDYDLPQWERAELEKSWVILSSYSGNTEEVLSSFQHARKLKLPVAVIAVGGKLLELAQAEKLPYLKLPATGIQPRSALGFSLLALLKLLAAEDLLLQAANLSHRLQPSFWQPRGQELARELLDKVPIIYSATKNQAICYNWKIKLNETGKIPAFYNLLPELNHNEMTGFDVQPSSRHLSDKFFFLLLADQADQPRLAKRMEVLEKLYRARQLPIKVLELVGQTDLEKVFNSLLLADWTAFYISQAYGLEAEQVPMVEEFKKLIK